jgi:hypothetical protein
MASAGSAATLHPSKLAMRTPFKYKLPLLNFSHFAGADSNRMRAQKLGTSCGTGTDGPSVSGRNHLTVSGNRQPLTWAGRLLLAKRPTRCLMLLLLSPCCLHKLNSSSLPSAQMNRSKRAIWSDQMPWRRDAPVGARLLRGDQVALLAAAAIS